MLLRKFEHREKFNDNISSVNWASRIWSSNGSAFGLTERKSHFGWNDEDQPWSYQNLLQNLDFFSTTIGWILILGQKPTQLDIPWQKSTQPNTIQHIQTQSNTSTLGCGRVVKFRVSSPHFLAISGIGSSSGSSSPPNWASGRFG